MNSRVGRVALKLRLDESDRERADELRHTVERVVIQQALDELERIVHERLGPSAILRARSLSLRWRLDGDVLDDAASALDMGRDLAAALLATIDALPRPERLRPDPRRDVVVFADNDHEIAAFLADVSEGRTAWFHAPRANARHVWSTIMQEGQPRVEAVTRWLERMECSDHVVRWLVDTTAASPARLEPQRDPVRTPSAGVAPRALPATQDMRASSTELVHTASHASARDTPVPTIEHMELVREHSVVATRAGGIWYFARLVLELELAEHLWQVGVHEGEFLAHVVAAISGADLVDDPAWRWFGGSFDREPALDAIADWADDEISTKLAITLARLELDTEAATPPCVTSAPDARTAAVVSRCAAALVQLFCARLGTAPDLELVRRLLRVPGRLELHDPLRVVMPMDCIDLDVRRAGLDFDPGYLPWLQRKVVIEFVASPAAPV